MKSSEKQIGIPAEKDMVSWGHHFVHESVPDSILQAAAGGEVTFVFTNQVDRKLEPIDSKETCHTPRQVERRQLPTDASLKTKLSSPLQLKKHSPPSTTTLIGSSDEDSPNGNISNIFKPFQKSRSHSFRTPLKPVSTPKAWSISQGNNLPLKRTPVLLDDTDDDFMKLFT